MPVRKICAKKPGAVDTLARQVSQATCDLLVESHRVLVVYGKRSASIYYEDEPGEPGPGPHQPPLSRAS